MFALSLSISFYFLLFDHFMFKKGGRKVAAAASSEKSEGGTLFLSLPGFRQGLVSILSKYILYSDWFDCFLFYI
jgi:hypothetical protein